MSNTNFTIKDDQKTLVVERVFPANKSKVWAAWTQPEQFAKWWGPKGWETTVKHMDFSEGGYLLYGMTCKDESQGEWFGKTSWGKSTYKRIDAENSFEYIDEFCDENGEVTSEMPATEVIIDFKEEDGSTKIISASIFESPEALKQVIDMGMKEGFEQTLDRLEEFVAE